MNFLTHLYFSSDSTENITGLILGNNAKESHLSKYNLETLKGVAFSMQILSFSENHPAYNNSLKRINPRYISCAPLLINIFYDHFLAKNWDKYSKISLEEFSMKIYRVVLNNRNSFPYKIRKFAPEMVEKKWITSIASLEGTHWYINSVTKKKNFDRVFFELTENYQQFKNDFEEYFEDLCKFIQEEVQRFNTIKDEKELFLLSA